MNQRADAAAGREVLPSDEYTLSKWPSGSVEFSREENASVSSWLKLAMIDCAHSSDQRSLRRKYCSINVRGSCAVYCASEWSAVAWFPALLREVRHSITAGPWPSRAR